jgi:hypothetical protein
LFFALKVDSVIQGNSVVGKNVVYKAIPRVLLKNPRLFFLEAKSFIGIKALTIKVQMR